MSIEQWSALVLVIVLPLLEGVARLRRARMSRREDGGAGDAVPRAPTPRGSPPLPNQTRDGLIHAEDQTARPARTSVPPPLPESRTAPGVSVVCSPPSHAMSATTPEAQRRGQRPLCGYGVAQWVRPVRNLRRAIILTTILSPTRR